MNPTPTNIPIEEIVANSRLAFMHGKYDESLRFAKLAIGQDPKNSDAQQWRNMNAWHTKK